MKRVLLTLIFVATLALTSACVGNNPKNKADKALKEFETLIEKMEKEKSKGDLTVEEWTKLYEDFNARYEALELDDVEFTPMQNLKLLSLSARWMVAITPETE